MNACNDPKIGRAWTQSRLVTVLLFLIAQAVVALMVGSVALAVSFGAA